MNNGEAGYEVECRLKREGFIDALVHGQFTDRAEATQRAERFYPLTERRAQGETWMHRSESIIEIDRRRVQSGVRSLRLCAADTRRADGEEWDSPPDSLPISEIHAPEFRFTLPNTPRVDDGEGDEG